VLISCPYAPSSILLYSMPCLVISLRKYMLEISHAR
jgi:hypothetical protein